MYGKYIHLIFQEDYKRIGGKIENRILCLSYIKGNATTKENLPVLQRTRA